MLMLVRYHRFLLSIKHGGSNVLWQPWQDLDTAKAKKELLGLFSINKVPDFIEQYKFRSKYIAQTPEEFETTLKEYGPLIYVGTIPGSVAGVGQPFQHTIVIYGMEDKDDGTWDVLFNDPNARQKRRLEFYGLLVELIPAVSQGEKVLVIFI